MLRNLASSLILTERDAEFDSNTPAVKGRVTTTLQKAKEVRPLVEKCITIARRSLEHSENAEQFSTDAERGSSEWKSWRSSDQWQKWCEAIAPAVAARRRALQLLGDKQAVQILFDDLAPRFADRNGGYTRVLRLAERRLGDAGEQAIIEFVGVHDRETTRSEKPAFADEDAKDKDAEDENAEDEAPADEPEASAEDDQVEDSADEQDDSADDKTD